MPCSNGIVPAVAAAAALLCAASSSPGGVVDVHWDGGGSGSGYCTDLNWDFDLVPLDDQFNQYHAIIDLGSNPTVSLATDCGVGAIVSSMTLGNDDQLRLLAGTDLTVPVSASIGGILYGLGGHFHATGDAMFAGNRARLWAQDGSVIEFPADFLSTTGLWVDDGFSSSNPYPVDVLWSSGTGSLLDLWVDEQGLLEIDAGFNSSGNDRDMQKFTATNGGVIDLSGVTVVTAPVDSIDQIEFNTDGSSLIHLDALESIASAGSGRTIFNVNGSVQALPVLTTINRGHFIVSGGGEVEIGPLASTANTMIWVSEASSLTELGATSTFSSLGIWTDDGFSSSNPYPVDLLLSSGADSVLDLSSVTSIDAGFNSSGNDRDSQKITATEGGLLDLSSVTLITSPSDSTDEVQLNVSGAGSVLDLSSLETLTTAAWGKTRIDVTNGGALDLPAVTFWKQVQIDVDGGAQLTARGLASTYDTTSFWVDDGFSSSNPYPFDVVRCLGAGSLVDLSSVAEIDAGFDSSGNDSDIQKFTATNGGEMDLSGVTLVTAPNDSIDRVEFNATGGDDGPSLIDLSSLGTLVGVGAGTFIFNVSGGSEIRVGSLIINDPTTFNVGAGRFHALGKLRALVPATINLDDPAAVLDVDGPLALDDLIALTAFEGGTLEIGGHFSHAHTAEGPPGATSRVTVHMDGDFTQLLEAAGVDIGPQEPSAVNDNFGFAQLIVGRDDQETMVRLRDTFDNGNRLGGNPEALYLFGDSRGGLVDSSLRVLGGSTLILDGIKLYYYDNAKGTWHDANALFPAGENLIPFDNGFLMLVGPSDGIGFELPALVATLAEPTSVGSVDFDGTDGRDIALTELGPTSKSPGRFIVLMNDGSGLEYAFVPTGVGIEPLDAALADFDGANGPDAAVANAGDGTISILLNAGTGNGTFIAQKPLVIGGRPVAIDAGFLDGDASVDLAVVDETAGTVTPLFGDGNGGFAPGTPLLVGAMPIAIAIADLDGAGGLDVAVANGGSGTVTIWFGGGDGTFASPINVPAGSMPTDVDPADIDNDKDVDLLVANNGSGDVSVLLNDGVGGFTPMVVGVGASPTSLVIDDFDVDGDQDFIVVAGVNGDRAARVFQNELMDGMADFFNVFDLAPDPFLQFVESSPLNGDFLSDLIVVNVDTESAAVISGQAPAGEVFVLLNVPPCFGDINDDCQVEFEDLSELVVHWGECVDPEHCPWDLDGDADVAFHDLFLLLESWGPCDVTSFLSCPADFDGSGEVTFGDLILFLAAWGPCPPGGCPADFTGDDMVGFDDLIEFLSAWGPCPANPGGVPPCGF